MKMRLGTNKAVGFSQLFALSSRNKAVKQALESHYECFLVTNALEELIE